jgi:hypothetical protein
MKGSRRLSGRSSKSINEAEEVEEIEEKKVKKVKKVKKETRLLAEMSYEPEEDGEGSAEEQAGDDREIERGAFAAMDDVSREAAEAQRKFSAQVEKSADEDEEGSENEESAAEFAERVHKKIVEEMT